MQNIQLLSLTISLFLLFSPLSAQKARDVKDVPSECEYVRHALDQSILSSMDSPDSVTIFIFRTGKGENSKGLSNRRVQNVKAHLVFRKADLNRFVFAEGETVEGLGRLEIYIGGKLVWKLFAKENLPFGYDCTASS